MPQHRGRRNRRDRMSIVGYPTALPILRICVSCQCDLDSEAPRFVKSFTSQDWQEPNDVFYPKVLIITLTLNIILVFKLRMLSSISCPVKLA